MLQKYNMLLSLLQFMVLDSENYPSYTGLIEEKILCAVRFTYLQVYANI